MLTLQVLELLGWQKVAYVVGEGTMIGGRRQTAGKNKAMFQSLQSGEMQAGVLSIKVAGAGLNCQHMNTIIFMAPCATETIQTQAKGMVCLYRATLTNEGRIGRPGQKDPAPKWRTIQCSDEAFDKVSITCRESRMKEAEAILMVCGEQLLTRY
jgi:hypothetical protein